MLAITCPSAVNHSGGANPGTVHFDLLQVVTQHLLLCLAGEQAELGAAPENIVGVCRPFLAAQIIYLAGEQATANSLAQVVRALHTFKQTPYAATVGQCPALGDFRR